MGTQLDRRVVTALGLGEEQGPEHLGGSQR